jgi:hypothetical protein
MVSTLILCLTEKQKKEKDKALVKSTVDERKRLNYKTRIPRYPQSLVNRFPVPDDKVGWEVRRTNLSLAWINKILHKHTYAYVCNTIIVPSKYMVICNVTIFRFSIVLVFMCGIFFMPPKVKWALIDFGLFVYIFNLNHHKVTCKVMELDTEFVQIRSAEKIHQAKDKYQVNV